MMQNPQSAQAHDWSNLPPIPDYPPDQRTSPQAAAWHIAWPVVLAFDVIIFNAYIKPFFWWWSWLWLLLFGALILRAIYICPSGAQKIWFIACALFYIFGWEVSHLFLTGGAAKLWEEQVWPLVWPLFLAGLIIWLNWRSALLPWWWHWAWPFVLAAMLVILGIVIGQWSALHLVH